MPSISYFLLLPLAKTFQMHVHTLNEMQHHFIVIANRPAQIPIKMLEFINITV
jgi:hypothetical protein